MLKLLPPTKDAFEQHIKRACLATIIDKSAHIAKPNLPPFTDYGWLRKDDEYIPLKTQVPAWPEGMKEKAACTCTKGCSKNCGCSKRGIACYIGCKCTGMPKWCSRAKAQEDIESPNTSESESDDELCL